MKIPFVYKEIKVINTICFILILLNISNILLFSITNNYHIELFEIFSTENTSQFDIFFSKLKILIPNIFNKFPDFAKNYGQIILAFVTIFIVVLDKYIKPYFVKYKIKISQLIKNNFNSNISLQIKSGILNYKPLNPTFKYLIRVENKSNIPKPILSGCFFSLTKVNEDMIINKIINGFERNTLQLTDFEIFCPFSFKFIFEVNKDVYNFNSTEEAFEKTINNIIKAIDDPDSKFYIINLEKVQLNIFDKYNIDIYSNGKVPIDFKEIVTSQFKFFSNELIKDIKLNIKFKKNNDKLIIEEFINSLENLLNKLYTIISLQTKLHYIEINNDKRSINYKEITEQKTEIHRVVENYLKKLSIDLFNNFYYEKKQLKWDNHSKDCILLADYLISNFINDNFNPNDFFEITIN